MQPIHNPSSLPLPAAYRQASIRRGKGEGDIRSSENQDIKKHFYSDVLLF
jgi:hypothetical protein